LAKLIEVKKVETYIGTVYRFYVRGIYFGAASTRAKAMEVGKRALDTWDFKPLRRKQQRSYRS
jgi:hypothetical protein